MFLCEKNVRKEERRNFSFASMVIYILGMLCMQVLKIFFCKALQKSSYIQKNYVTVIRLQYNKICRQWKNQKNISSTRLGLLRELLYIFYSLYILDMYLVIRCTLKGNELATAMKTAVSLTIKVSLLLSYITVNIYNRILVYSVNTPF